MTKTTDLFGKPYDIKLCKFGDIVDHFEKIKDMIPEKEHKDFLGRMSECIDYGTAFALSDDSCFLYYKNYHKKFADGIALFGKNSPIKMLALFSGVFTKIDTDTFKIDFHLHSGKFIAEYKSLLTLGSMKRSHHHNTPLVIRVDKLTSKISSLHAVRGIQWVT